MSFFRLRVCDIHNYTFLMSESKFIFFHPYIQGAKRSTGGLSSKNRMSVRRPWQSSRGTATLMNTFGTNQVESISEDMKSVNMQENKEDARTTSVHFT